MDYIEKEKKSNEANFINYKLKKLKLLRFHKNKSKLFNIYLVKRAILEELRT